MGVDEKNQRADGTAHADKKEVKQAKDSRRGPGGQEPANEIVGAGDQTSSSAHHRSPKGGGEHKSLNDKDLSAPRRLFTNTPPRPERVQAEDDALADDARKMVSSPRFAEQIVEDVQALGIVGEALLILMVYVTATGRLLRRAIHLCVYGGFSTGKSFVVGKVLDLFPLADVIRATQITEKHLLNIEKAHADRYRNKVIFIAEQIHAEVGLAFREMAESGEVRSLTVRDGKSEILAASGPVTFIATTTLVPDEVKAEDASRMFYLATDDSEELTERVMNAQAARAKDPPAADNKYVLMKKHRDAQRFLAKHANVVVIIPFAELIKLPADDPGSRRLHDRVLLLLEAVTFLHQFRKGRRREERDGTTRVYADAEDWRIALPLIEVIIPQKYGLPDKAGNEFSEKVKQLGLGAGPFSIEYLSKETGMSESTVRRRIKRLPRCCVHEQGDMKKYWYTFRWDSSPSQGIGLPTVEEVRADLRDSEKLTGST